MYVHKEQELDNVAQSLPADHYVMDDKLRIHAGVKEILGLRVTNVSVRQGYYSLDPKILATYPAADLSIGWRLLNYDLHKLQRLPASIDVLT